MDRESKKSAWGLYDYSLVNYINNKTPITVICSKHGIFNPYPGNHLFKKSTCSKCAAEERSIRYTKSVDVFIKQAKLKHNNKYDYTNAIYIGKGVPLEITCKKHGIFMQTPSIHLAGSGCPKCSLKAQAKVFDAIALNFPELEIRWEAALSWLRGQRFDIYIPILNLAIEYNGIQHYESMEFMGGIEKFKLTQKRDKSKKEKCIKNNCELHELKYDYTKEDMSDLISRIHFLLQKQI